jgi:hypothetical protein
VETGNNNKIEQRFSFTDPSFKSEEASSQDLSVSINPDGLSFSVSRQGKLLLLKDYRFSKIHSPRLLSEKIKGILQKEFANEPAFSKVTVVVANNRFITIPAPLYDERNAKELLQLNCEPEDNEEVFNDYLKTPEAYNVYAVSKDLYQEIYHHFGKVRTIHQVSVLINTLLEKYKNTTENILLLNVNSLNFEIILVSDNKLRFCNSFHYHKNEDIVYYLLFVCEQLKLNPEHVKLKLSGEVTADSELYRMLFEYLRNIEFYIGASSKNLSDSDFARESAYFSLLNS